MTERLTHECDAVARSRLSVLRSVLRPVGCNGNRGVLMRKRIYEGVSCVRGKLIHRFCAGCSGRMARRLNISRSVFVYVRDLFGRAPSCLRIRTLRPALMCTLPGTGLRTTTVEGMGVRVLCHGVLRRDLVRSRMRTSLVQFRATPGGCGHLYRLGPRIILHTPLACVTDCLRVAPRALSHVQSGALLW